MRGLLISAVASVFTMTTVAASVAAVKLVPYPEVKVELPDTYRPDAAFEKMQRTFADAVAKKDTERLLSLLGPTFVWMSQGAVSDEFDFGGDAVQNFKVVFGFRQSGKQVDGGVTDGPFWDLLAGFAADQNFDMVTDTLVCGPTVASVADEDVFKNVRQKIGADDSVEWYFTVAETAVTAAPGGGPPVGRVVKLALPVLDVYPPVPEGQAGPAPTHLKVLLPSGKSGWIPFAAASPLSTDRLCYAHPPGGEWKIVGFDQAQ
jgi:hypothetical protein